MVWFSQRSRKIFGNRSICKKAFSQCEHDIFYAVLKPHIAELVPALRVESSLPLFGHLRNMALKQFRVDDGCGNHVVRHSHNMPRLYQLGLNQHSVYAGG